MAGPGGRSSGHEPRCHVYAHGCGPESGLCDGARAPDWQHAPPRTAAAAAAAADLADAAVAAATAAENAAASKTLGSAAGAAAARAGRRGADCGRPTARAGGGASASTRNRVPSATLCHGAAEDGRAFARDGRLAGAAGASRGAEHGRRDRLAGASLGRLVPLRDAAAAGRAAAHPLQGGIAPPPCSTVRSDRIRAAMARWLAALIGRHVFAGERCDLPAAASLAAGASIDADALREIAAADALRGSIRSERRRLVLGVRRGFRPYIGSPLISLNKRSASGASILRVRCGPRARCAAIRQRRVQRRAIIQCFRKSRARSSGRHVASNH